MFVGGPTVGYLDGTGASAQFNYISAIATDPSGNVYVADNNRIRKISSTGVVSTLAGNGVAGFADGQGNSAQFNSPQGIAVDASWNVYVCDGGNHRIRKITSGGLVITLAGSGIAGNTDGNGRAALFSFPYGIVIDTSGNLFVDDLKNFNVRKIMPDGNVTTFAGNATAGFVNGTGTSAQFFYPQGMAIDAAGNIFVSDSDYNNDFYYVRMINKAGVVSTFLGDTSKGPLRDAQINYTVNFPDGIAFDPQGNMYFTNTGVGIDNVGGSYISKVTFH
jgi:sugar lactone lactonase YvrE